MAQHKVVVNTVAYRRTHGTYPWNTQGHGKGLWAFRLDDETHVTVRYGTYKNALASAQACATTIVHVLP